MQLFELRDREERGRRARTGNAQEERKKERKKTGTDDRLRGAEGNTGRAMLFSRLSLNVDLIKCVQRVEGAARFLRDTYFLNNRGHLL